MRPSFYKPARLFLIAVVTISLAHCKAADPDSQANSGVSNCFTQLFPGRLVEGNKLHNVIFQNGACLGEYKALNKISYQEKIYLSADSLALTGSEEAILKVDNGIVAAHSNSGVKRIGIIDPESFAIRTDPGVEFELLTPSDNDSFSPWRLGSGPNLEASQTERIVIRVPY